MEQFVRNAYQIKQLENSYKLKSESLSTDQIIKIISEQNQEIQDKIANDDIDFEISESEQEAHDQEREANIENNDKSEGDKSITPSKIDNLIQ